MRNRGTRGPAGSLVMTVALAVSICLSVHAIDAPTMDLADAVEAGHVTVTAMGEAGLDRVSVELRSHDARTLRIVISPATLFSFGDAGVQRMGSTEEVIVLLVPGEPRRVVVPAACFDMRLAPPAEGMRSQGGVERLLDHAVASVITTPGFRSAGFRVRQFAIWTLMTHPATAADYEGMSVGGAVARALEEEGVPLELLGLFYQAPDVAYMLSAQELAAVEFLFSRGGLPFQGAAELYMLFTSGGPTRGELAHVARILAAAELPLDPYPAVKHAQQDVS